MLLSWVMTCIDISKEEGRKIMLKLKIKKICSEIDFVNHPLLLAQIGEIELTIINTGHNQKLTLSLNCNWFPHEFCSFADIATKNTSSAGFGTEKTIPGSDSGTQSICVKIKPIKEIKSRMQALRGEDEEDDPNMERTE